MPKLGRYQTIQELGRGGSAVVYLARDTATEREVAVKVLSSHLLHDPDLLARFEREIKLAVRLEHPHIVPILDVGTEGEFPYIVMRLLAGGSLSDRIRQGALSAAETVRVVQQVASALDEAHRQHIVHRDLKPSNILFDQRGTAYLADFGVARLMDAVDSLTVSAGVVGTPAYMSPEQLKGQPITGLADQYALGLVTFQALTARLPYEGTTAQMILQQLQEPLPSVRRYNASLSPDFERVLARATAKDPGARYAAASEFAAALAAAAAEAPLPVLASASRPSLVTQQDIALITPPPMARPLPHEMAAPLVAPALLKPAALGAASPAPTSTGSGVVHPLPPPAEPRSRPAQRIWIALALLLAVLAVVIGLGRQWLAATAPLPPAPTATASASVTGAPSVTPAPPASPAATEAATLLITLDADAIALAVVELPPGLVAAALHDLPQGVVIAEVPDRSIVQVLRGREVTPDDVVWVKVRLLTGEVGWLVKTLLRYLAETTVEATPEPAPTMRAGATSAAPTSIVSSTEPATQPGAAATTATQPAGPSTQAPAASATSGSAPGSTTAAPAATRAPTVTPRPPASNTPPPPTATSVPSATSVPPTPVPPTATTVLDPIVDPVETLDCTIPLLCP